MKHLALLVIGLATLAAVGQQPPPRGPGGMPGGARGGSLFLVFMPDVQKELVITGAQKEQIGKLMQNGMAQMRPPKGDAKGGAASRPKPEDWAKRYQDMQTKLNAILNAKQKARLDQIGLQMQGPMALADDDVAKKVGLDAKQKATIRKITTKYGTEFAANSQDVARTDWQKIAKEMQTKREAANKAILATLSSTQKGTWTKLQGKPFKLQPMRMNRPAGAGGPPSKGG